MSKHYPKSLLRMLRNDIPIDMVIADMLKMQRRHCDKHLRFLCPLCYNFHTSTNRKTNLARCFDCTKNFNPIDMVIAVAQCSFTEAVEFLINKSQFKI